MFGDNVRPEESSQLLGLAAHVRLHKRVIVCESALSHKEVAAPPDQHFDFLGNFFRQGFMDLSDALGSNAAYSNDLDKSPPTLAGPTKVDA